MYSFTVDCIIKATEIDSFTTDLIIKETKTDGFTIDALIAPQAVIVIPEFVPTRYMRHRMRRGV